MSDRTTYEIVIKGRASARLLRPLLDDFTVGHCADGTTHLIGAITDAAQLHGIHAHLASVHAEVVSIAPLTASAHQPDQPRSTQP